MPDTTNYLVRNSANVPCEACTEVHEFLSIGAGSKDARCNTPVAYRQDLAEQLAASPDDVIEVPDNTMVVLHPSARKLPRSTVSTRAEVLGIRTM